MSINVDMEDARDVDFSSYEYQHIQFSVGLSGTDKSGSTTITQNVDPLEDIGGLDTNEVAELVGMYRQVYFDLDGQEQTANDSPGSLEYRSTFGIGLDSESDLLSTTASLGSGDATVLTQEGTDTPVTDIFENTKDEILDHVGACYEAGFLNATDQAGGSGGATNTDLSRTVNFRELLGAGPVLDSNDSISMVQRLVKNAYDLGDTTIQYRVTLIWDVAEVSDAGGRFGIPQ